MRCHRASVCHPKNAITFVAVAHQPDDPFVASQSTASSCPLSLWWILLLSMAALCDALYVRHNKGAFSSFHSIRSDLVCVTNEPEDLTEMECWCISSPLFAIVRYGCGCIELASGFIVVDETDCISVRAANEQTKLNEIYGLFIIFNWMEWASAIVRSMPRSKYEFLLAQYYSLGLLMNAFLEESFDGHPAMGHSRQPSVWFEGEISLESRFDVGRVGPLGLMKGCRLSQTYRRPPLRS